MRQTLTSVFALAASLSTANAQGSFEDWHPAGPGDFRGPCPMLNTLTNHDFLPHDGKAITLENTVHALGAALNISAELSGFLFDFALTTTAEENATTFNLRDLGRHNILEHDASLSRADFFFGQDGSSFNATVFAETKSYWDETINLKSAAESRLARIATSQKTNPNYTMSDLGDAFGVGEVAAYIIMLGDKEAGTAEKKVISYFFENERLPTELGWETPEAVTQEVLFSMMDRLKAAVNMTDSNTVRVRTVHAGAQWKA